MRGKHYHYRGEFCIRTEWQWKAFLAVSMRRPSAEVRWNPMSDTMGVRSWKPGKMRRRDRVLAVAFATILNATSSRTQQRVWATDFGPSLGVSEFDQNWIPSPDDNSCCYR